MACQCRMVTRPLTAAARAKSQWLRANVQQGPHATGRSTTSQTHVKHSLAPISGNVGISQTPSLPPKRSPVVKTTPLRS
eukprot:11213420-Lingulodinium_polyedra.AAC.1